MNHPLVPWKLAHEEEAADYSSKNLSINTTDLASPLTPSYHRRVRNNYTLSSGGPSFGETLHHHRLVKGTDGPQQALDFDIQAQMDKGFFFHAPAQEWTCYRRNYFQLSVRLRTEDRHHVDFSHLNDWRVEIQGRSYAVERLQISVTSRHADTDRPIELIQQTSKRDHGPQFAPLPQQVSASGMDTEKDVVVFERIQFKTATANNGKKRSTQHFFVVEVHTDAVTTEGQVVRLATKTSCPLVVRGRSPIHYQDRPQQLQARRLSPSEQAAMRETLRDWVPETPSSAQWNTMFGQHWNSLSNAMHPSPPQTAVSALSATMHNVNSPLLNISTSLQNTSSSSSSPPPRPPPAAYSSSSTSFNWATSPSSHYNTPSQTIVSPPAAPWQQQTSETLLKMPPLSGSSSLLLSPGGWSSGSEDSPTRQSPLLMSSALRGSLSIQTTQSKPGMDLPSSYLPSPFKDSYMLHVLPSPLKENFAFPTLTSPLKETFGLSS